MYQLLGPIRAIHFGRIVQGSSINDVLPMSNENIISFLKDIEAAGSSSALSRVMEPLATEIANSNINCEVENPLEVI